MLHRGPRYEEVCCIEDPLLIILSLIRVLTLLITICPFTPNPPVTTPVNPHQLLYCLWCQQFKWSRTFHPLTCAWEKRFKEHREKSKKTVPINLVITKLILMAFCLDHVFYCWKKIIKHQLLMLVEGLIKQHICDSKIWSITNHSYQCCSTSRENTPLHMKK